LTIAAQISERMAPPSQSDRVGSRKPGSAPGAAAATSGAKASEPVPVRVRSRVAPRPRASLVDAPDRAAAGDRAERARAPVDLPRILLLNPPRVDGIPVIRLHRSEYLFVQGNHIPPMDLGYFAAAAKGLAALEIVDANALDLSQAQTLARIAAFRPDVIVCKGVVNILDRDLFAALEYKKSHPHVKVVLSCRGCLGAESAVFAEFPLLDGIARGEVDAFARDLCSRPHLEDIPGLARPGEAEPIVRVVEDLDRDPIPDLEVMPKLWGTGYRIPYYGIPSGYFLLSSRGCPYTCTYCMVGGIDGRPFRYRRRDPDNVIAELELLRTRYGVSDCYVFDEIFTTPGHGEKVCDRILSAGIQARWICEGKPDLVNRPMLQTMKKAGCVAIYFGIETGDDGILTEVEKGHSSEQARRAIELTQEAGIMAAAYIMLGFPGETVRSYLKTVQFLRQAKPSLIRYGFLAPYPVTVMHREMVEQGLLSFDRAVVDRHISPYFSSKFALRSRALRPSALKAMDFLFKKGFHAELTRSPPLG
jgi:anaerobic magnesium-protoporphyrin IX monomethyl ester cyclase